MSLASGYCEKTPARGKPLPGIAKKTVQPLCSASFHPTPVMNGAVGDDLVLIALSTAIVTSVINGVFKY